MTQADPDIVEPDARTLPAEDVHLPPRGFTIDRCKAYLAAALCWSGLAAMVFLVLYGMTVRIDTAGLKLFRVGPAFEPMGGLHIREAVRDVTALGGFFLGTLFVAMAVTALLFLRLRREAILLLMTVVLGWLVNKGLKLLVGRERPQIVPHLTEAGGESFPSGHSFGAAVVYIAIAIAFASMSARHSVRYTIIGAAMAVSAMVAWSRVMLGVHFPSDVIAGWLGGAGWAFLAAALLYQPAQAAADSEAVDKADPLR